MSRKLVVVSACWLAAASVAVAQTPPPAVKGKLLSPYYATASTLDWSADDESPIRPELLPPPATKPAAFPTPPVVQAAVPAAPAPQSAAVRQTGATVPAEPAQPSPPAANAPTLPPDAVTAPTKTLPPPAAGTQDKSAVVPAAPAGSTGAPNCNCNCNPCGPNGPCGPAGRFWVSGELLLWWPKGMVLATLVT